MRSFVLLVSSLVLITFLGCSKKQYPPFSPELSFVSKEANGLVILRSNGFGGNIDAATNDAQRNAFYHIIFKGIPGTELNVPMVDNEANAKAKHKDYIDKFFGGKYQEFMLTSTITSNLIAVNGGYQITVEVKINTNSLRKDLEQNQVIRKFGF